MKIEQRGEIITVDEFWTCECDGDYIHRKAERQCPICKTCGDEMPDAMLYEILIDFEDLNWNERHELVHYLYDKLISFAP
jgi:hypothetical protein